MVKELVKSISKFIGQFNNSAGMFQKTKSVGKKYRIFKVYKASNLAESKSDTNEVLE